MHAFTFQEQINKQRTKYIFMHYKTPVINSVGWGIVGERGFAASFPAETSSKQVFFDNGTIDDEFSPGTN